MSVQVTALDLRSAARNPQPWQDAGWLALGAAAYFLLGLLGRATIKEGEVLSLVWPAAGAAMLFYGLTAPRRWPLVTVLVALATVGLNLLTGATWTQVAIFVTSNVTQAICAVLLLRAFAPHLRGAGGEEPLEQLRDFWPIMATSVLGSLVGAAIGGLGRGLLLDSWSWMDFMVWWGRNTAGCIVVVTTVLLALAAWQRRPETAHAAHLRAIVASRGIEAGLLVLVTAATYLAVFVWYSSLPVAFPLLAPTVWAGLRFNPFPVAVHSVAVCTTVVGFTLAGSGPFATVGEWNDEVLVAQLFIVLVFCLGVLLALGRIERLALTSTISQARADSEGQARLLSAIIDGMHDGVTVLNEDGQVQQRNPAGAEMIRSTTDALDGIMDSKFALTVDGQPMPPEDYPWVRAFAGDTVVDQDMVLVFEDGSPNRTLSVSATTLPSLDGDGRRQAVLIYHDVTKDRAQRSALESFAGVVAHDLLGPLAVLEGWTELLSSELEESASLTQEDAEPTLARIQVSLGTMRQLVDDLLESSTSRDQELRSVVVDLRSMAQAIADLRSEVTSGERPRIEITSLPEVYADAVLVRQLLDNLIGNAVKYVIPGEAAVVRVTGRVLGDLVEVTVADEGIGIAPDQRDEVFEAFQRGRSSEGYAGHGIGLSVCKRIVERHGGRISARPPLGDRGTRIVFTLPGVPSG
ncbi:MAG: ATP-binding protein [Marmoricola sp.]